MTKPTAPADNAVIEETVEGVTSKYVFGGWYTEAACTTAWDFDNEVTTDLTLYAKWVEYLAPRTVKPTEKEDDEDFDHDAYYDALKNKKFFTTEYQAGLFDLLKDDESVENMQVPETSTFDETLRTYINEGLATLKKNLVNNVHKEDFNECYEYYLNSQMESLLVEKLERVIGSEVTVSAEEVQREFNLQVEQNKDTFNASSSAYSSALTSSLGSTYYHTSTDDSYGFVINILLKLDEDEVAKLNKRYTNQQSKEMVRIERNNMVSEMQINVSNPDYDPEAQVLDAEGNEIKLRDPMTDPNNPYLATDHTYNADNNYNQIISFEKDDEGNFQIVYNAKEHPAMAYLTQKVYAFDHAEQVGIIHQINNSLKMVKDFVASGELTHVEGVYWLREVATAWLYLVGDDSGAVSSDSNNGGLGYLVTPAGQSSSYLEDFTTYARNLIAAGTGSYQVGAVANADFAVADAYGNLAGDGKAFVVADNVGSSSAYAGVFVLLASDKVWDDTAYTTENVSGAKLNAEQAVVLGDDGVLPLNYVLTYAKNVEDVKTVYDNIYDTLLAGKKASAYKSKAQEVVDNNEIQYFEKVYKQLYEKLDD